MSNEAQNIQKTDNKRKNTRIYLEEYRDFTVHLQLAEISFDGFLANISQTGLCIILPADVSHLDVPEESMGAIMSSRLREPIDFNGTIIWTAEEHHNGKMHLLAGIRFNEHIAMPNSIIAMSIATEDK